MLADGVANREGFQGVAVTIPDRDLRHHVQALSAVIGEAREERIDLQLGGAPLGKGGELLPVIRAEHPHTPSSIVKSRLE